jgi:hypothetical protein
MSKIFFCSQYRSETVPDQQLFCAEQRNHYMVKQLKKVFALRRHHFPLHEAKGSENVPNLICIQLLFTVNQNPVENQNGQSQSSSTSDRLQRVTPVTLSSPVTEELKTEIARGDDLDDKTVGLYLLKDWMRMQKCVKSSDGSWRSTAVQPFPWVCSKGLFRFLPVHHISDIQTCILSTAIHAM